MGLRKSPLRTPAMLAANRANALKSTGLRTACGKGRVALNSLRHGRCALCLLPEKLIQAGKRRREVLYRWFCSEVTASFALDDRTESRQAEQFAARAWCRAGKRGLLRSKAGICLRMSDFGTAATLAIPIPLYFRSELRTPGGMMRPTESQALFT